MSLQSRIYCSQPVFNGNERRYLVDCIDHGWITQGPYVRRFEEELAELCGAKYAVACSSGTAALHLAMLALGVRCGTDVIVPAFTYVATANAVRYCNGNVIFCDISVRDWCLGHDDLSALFDRHGETTIAIGVDVYDATAIGGLEVIDAAHSLGTYKHNPHYSGMATFSLYGSKNISCFPAGTIVMVKPPKGGKGLSRVKAIESICLGDEVLSYNTQTSAKEYKRVTKTYSRQVSEDLVVLTLSNANRIKSTSEHPFFVAGRGWVAASKLKVGDKLIQHKYRGLNGCQTRGKTWEEMVGQEAADARSQATSEALRRAHAEGKFNTPRYIQSRPLAWARAAESARGRKHTQEFKDACAVRMRKRMEDPALREKISKQFKEWHLNNREEFLERMQRVNRDPAKRASNSAGVRRAMTRDSYWKNYFAGLSSKKNKAEARLETILNEVVPGEFIFNGDFSQGVRVGNFVPDFVHSGKKRKLIELFGCRWHSGEEVEKKQNFYASKGFESLFIWDFELKWREDLDESITEFTYNPNVKIVKIVEIETETYTGSVHNIAVEDNNNYFAKGVLVHNCGEGGAVVTNDEDLDRFLRLYRGQGATTPGRYHHSVIGYNYRLTDMQAAVGLAQLEQLPDFLSQRRHVIDRYRRNFASESRVTLQGGQRSAGWMMAVLLPRGTNRDAVASRLDGVNIETRPFFEPLPSLPPYAGHGDESDFPVAYDVARRGLCLPTHVGLSDNDVDRVSEELVRALNEAGT